MKRKSIKKITKRKTVKRTTIKRGGSSLNQDPNLFIAEKIFNKLGMKLTSNQIRSYSSIILSKLKEDDIEEIIRTFRSVTNEDLKRVLIEKNLAHSFDDTFLISLPTIS
jgi:hypothetical protein